MDNKGSKNDSHKESKNEAEKLTTNDKGEASGEKQAKGAREILPPAATAQLESKNEAEKLGTNDKGKASGTRRAKVAREIPLPAAAAPPPPLESESENENKGGGQTTSGTEESAYEHSDDSSSFEMDVTSVLDELLEQERQLQLKMDTCIKSIKDMKKKLKNLEKERLEISPYEDEKSKLAANKKLAAKERYLQRVLELLDTQKLEFKFKQCSLNLLIEEASFVEEESILEKQINQLKREIGTWRITGWICSIIRFFSNFGLA